MNGDPVRVTIQGNSIEGRNGVNSSLLVAGGWGGVRPFPTCRSCSDSPSAGVPTWRMSGEKQAFNPFERDRASVSLCVCGERERDRERNRE